MKVFACLPNLFRRCADRLLPQALLILFWRQSDDFAKTPVKVALVDVSSICIPLLHRNADADHRVCGAAKRFDSMCDVWQNAEQTARPVNSLLSVDDNTHCPLCHKAYDDMGSMGMRRIRLAAVLITNTLKPFTLVIFYIYIYTS